MKEHQRLRKGLQIKCSKATVSPSDGEAVKTIFT